jgi:hypothetical protein
MRITKLVIEHLSVTAYGHSIFAMGVHCRRAADMAVKCHVGPCPQNRPWIPGVVKISRTLSGSAFYMVLIAVFNIIPSSFFLTSLICLYIPKQFSSSIISNDGNKYNNQWFKCLQAFICLSLTSISHQGPPPAACCSYLLNWLVSQGLVVGRKKLLAEMVK